MPKKDKKKNQKNAKKKNKGKDKGKKIIGPKVSFEDSKAIVYEYLLKNNRPYNVI